MLTPFFSLADAAGWVSVNSSTTQHTKYPNIFSLGDASSLPNSKTAAAISCQAPVLVDNLRAHMDGQELKGVYDGYASWLVHTHTHYLSHSLLLFFCSIKFEERQLMFLMFIVLFLQVIMN